MKTDLIEKVKLFPRNCGVYKFYSKNQVMYVGKSKNLRSRVMSYFSKSHNREKIFIMMKYIDHVDFISTNTHLEALVLEYELIKKYRPMYNSMYKNDRNEYYYLNLSKDNIFKVNFKEGIGPFNSKKFLENFLNSMKNIYPIKYKDGKLDFKFSVFPNKLSINDIEETFYSLKFIFSSEDNMVLFIDFLETKMKLEAKLLKFETASFYRELIKYFSYLKNLEFERKVFKSGNYVVSIENCFYLISRGEIVYFNKDTTFEEFRDFSIDFLKDFDSYKNISNELKNIIYNECITDNVKVYKLK